MLQETLCLDSILDKMIRYNNLLYEYCPNKVSDICKYLNMMFTSIIFKCDEAYVQSRINQIHCYRRQLEELQKIPIVQQRSPEWYELRKNIVTASDFAQAFGDAKFGSQKQFYQKKCGFEEEKFNSSLPPLKWGIMFEPVAANIYKARFDCQMHEFGLIQHPSYKYFGASPDGITDYGIMVEIKCPFKRLITGEVPLQYYYQVQGQLDVCGLKECDYMECEFSCFDDLTSFFDSTIDTEHGVILEVNEQYTYSPIAYSQSDLETLRSWIDENKSDDITNIHYWKLNNFNIVRIYKNELFVREKLESLGDIWNKVKEYQKDKTLYDKDIKSSNPKRSLVKLTGYSFID